LIDDTAPLRYSDRVFASDAPSASDRACQRIREQLATGELQAGDRIFEVDLARSLGVSRTPVREALMRLRRDGLVVAQPRRGTFVAHPSPARFQQLLDYRIALEEFAVRTCANQLSESDLGRLLDAVSHLWKCTAEGDMYATIRGDLRVHELLIEIARNEPLRVAYAASLTDFTQCIHATSKHYASTCDLASELESLVRALQRRDADEAVGIMRRHILHGADDALNAFMLTGTAG